MTFPQRQIRALYDENTIRVYQAYNDNIADSALSNGTFQSPPFKMERMTWIKPSFLWMMYRSGWAQKDLGQNRILAIDISREGFEWALTNSILSGDAKKYPDKTEWQAVKNATPVRIQWDPERDLHLQPLGHRAIQIGLSNEAVPLFVDKWIKNITDVTEKAKQLGQLVADGKLDEAKSRLPNEQTYPLSAQLAEHLGCPMN